MAEMRDPGCESNARESKSAGSVGGSYAERRLARKQHACDNCGGRILAGTAFAYHRSYPSDDSGYAATAGHPVSFHECAECAGRNGRGGLLDARPNLPGEWRPLLGAEDRYLVSDSGQVWSRGFRRLLSQRKDRQGYLEANITYGADRQRHRKVHILVLESFVGPRPEGAFGCHNNGNPLDNRVENLRWDTPTGNALDTVAHGRNPHAQKTHCPQGHPYAGDNLSIRPKKRRGRDGGIGYERRCVTCARERWRQRPAKKRAA